MTWSGRRGAVLVAAALALAGCGGTRATERPIASGALVDPVPVDLNAELATRLAILNAAHPDPIRPYPAFSPKTEDDLVMEQVQSIEDAIAADRPDFALQLVHLVRERLNARQAAWEHEEAEIDRALVREQASGDHP